MKNFFTIGEIAKMKGIHIKSLRYYDKIGVLKPAYVNAETGYRYYTVEQLFFLDTILLSIELGIPLKEFQQFIDEKGNIRLQQFLSHAQLRMQKKIERLQIGMAKTEHILNDIIRHKENKNTPISHMRSLNERYILKIPFGEGEYATEYAQKVAKLVWLAEENGLHTNYLSGLIYYFSGQQTDKFIYIELLERHAPIAEFAKIPGGTYQCCSYKESVIETAACQIDRSRPSFAVEADVFESTVTYDSFTVELQIPQSS